MSEIVVERWVLIRATPERVWESISTPGGLAGWFAEDVSLEPGAGGQFSFAGADVLGGGNDTELLSFQPPSSLAFRWEIAGASTLVRLCVQPVEGAARVVAMHEVPADADLGFKSGSADGLHATWSYLLGCLKGYLELGAAPYRLRYPTPGARTLEQSMSVAVSATEAFAALTEPSQLDAWIGTGARVEPRAGGRFSLGWDAEERPGALGYGPSTIIDFDPGRRISYAWNAEGVPTVVQWRVEGDDTSARITLTHSGFLGDLGTLQDYAPGWADYMQALAIYLLTGQASSGWAGSGDGIAPS